MTQPSPSDVMLALPEPGWLTSEQRQGPGREPQVTAGRAATLLPLFRTQPSLGARKSLSLRFTVACPRRGFKGPRIDLN